MYNYRWSDQRNTYEVYDTISMAHIAWYSDVDEARARCVKLNAKRSRMR